MCKALTGGWKADSTLKLERRSTNSQYVLLSLKHISFKQVKQKVIFLNIYLKHNNWNKELTIYSTNG